MTRNRKWNSFTATAIATAALIAAAALPTSSAAAPIGYTFDFYTGNGYGTTPGGASFTYDDVTHQFSDFLIPFTVHDYTHIFDFTNTANSQGSQIGGTRCAGSTTAAEQMFDFLSQRSCSLFSTSGQTWLPWEISWNRTFRVVVEGGFYNNGYYVRQDDPIPGYYYLFGGDFYGNSTMIQAVSGDVPEPASLVLVALGLAGLGFAHRRRKS